MRAVTLTEEQKQKLAELKADYEIKNRTQARAFNALHKFYTTVGNVGDGESSFMSEDGNHLFIKNAFESKQGY